MFVLSLSESTIRRIEHTLVLRLEQTTRLAAEAEPESDAARHWTARRDDARALLDEFQDATRHTR
jgi:hypothetical protein